MSLTPMNAGQARLVDPILSTHARGYTAPEHIWSRIFPLAQIPTTMASVIAFGKEDFRVLNTKRAPGSTVKTVQIGYSKQPVAIQNSALDAIVPRELVEEAQFPNINLASRSIDTVMSIESNNLEVDAATIVQAPATYNGNTIALSGAAQWSNAASDPIVAIKDQITKMTTRIGRLPNKLVVSEAVFNKLSEHAKITDRYKYTNGAVITEELIARLLGLKEIIVGRHVYLPENAPDSAAATETWGKFAALLYVNDGGDYMSPSFGYTYNRNGYPVVEKPFFDTTTRSWRYGVTNQRAPQVLCPDAGFLWQTAIA